MIDQDVKLWILKALAAARKPVTDEWLRGAIASAFMHVTFSAADLKGYIRDAESAGLISGITDPAFGLMWALTPEGAIKAKQL